MALCTKYNVGIGLVWFGGLGYLAIKERNTSPTRYYNYEIAIHIVYRLDHAKKVFPPEILFKRSEKQSKICNYDKYLGL